MSDRNRDTEAESRKVLERVNTQMGASASRPGDDRGDWAEFWGRRVGRALGMIFLVVVIYWLYQLITGRG